MTLDELIVKLGLDSSGLTSGLDAASGKFKTLESQVDQMGGSIMKFGGLLTGAVTAPLAALSAIAISAERDFGGAMRIIQQTTGATGEALQDMGKILEEIKNKIPASEQAIATAMSAISARTGATGERLEKLSEQFLNLSRITHSEVGPLVAAATRLFEDWSIATEEQAGALDYLYRITQKTGANITNLTQILVQFGAPLRSLGFTFEQGAAMMGKWEKEGVNLETVLAGLRFALGKFAAAGKDPVEALKQIQERILNAGDASKQLAIAFEAFGKRAAADLGRAIIEGRFNIDELVKSLKASRTTINETAEETLSFSDKWKLLKYQVEEATRPLGRALLDILTDLMTQMKPLVGALASLSQGFKNLDPLVQKVVIAIGAAAAAAGPLLVAFGGLSTTANSMVKTMGLLNVAMGTAGLGGALTLLQPLAIAFGVAIATWAVYKAVTTIQQLNAQLAQLDQYLQSSKKATEEEAAAIGLLENALRRAGKELPSVFAGLDEDKLRTPTEYLKALQEAAKGLDLMKEGADLAAPSVGKLTVSLKDAAQKYLGWGEAARTVPFRDTEEDMQRVAAYAKKVADAFSALGLQADKTREMMAALVVLRKEWEAGRLSAGQWLMAIENLGHAIVKVQEAAKRKVEFAPLTGYDARIFDEIEDTFTRIRGDMEALRQIRLTFGGTPEELAVIAGNAERAGRNVRFLMQQFDYAIASARVFQAAATLGLTDLSEAARKAVLAYQEIAKSAKSSGEFIARAWLAMVDAQIAAGAKLDYAHARLYERLTEAVKGGTTKMAQFWLGLTDTMRSAFDRAGNTIVNAIWEWGGGVNEQLKQQETDLRTELDKRYADYQAHVEALRKQISLTFDMKEILALQTQINQAKKEWEDYAIAANQQIQSVETQYQSTMDKILGIAKTVFSEMGKLVAEFVARFLMDQLFTKLIHLTDTLIPGVGKAWDKVFKGISEGASAATKAATQIGKAGAAVAPAAVQGLEEATGAVSAGVAETGEAATTVASGSFMGIANLITGAVDAIAGVLQYLQGRRMEQDIGRLEVTSREIKAILLDSLAAFREFLPSLKDINEVLWQIYSAGGAGMGTAAAGTFTDALGQAADAAEAVSVNLGNLTGPVAAIIEAITTGTTAFTNAYTDGAVRVADAVTGPTGFTTSLRDASGQLAWWVDQFPDLYPVGKSFSDFWESVKETGISFEDAMKEWQQILGGQFTLLCAELKDTGQALAAFTSELLATGKYTRTQIENIFSRMPAVGLTANVAAILETVGIPTTGKYDPTQDRLRAEFDALVAAAEKEKLARDAAALEISLFGENVQWASEAMHRAVMSTFSVEALAESKARMDAYWAARAAELPGVAAGPSAAPAWTGPTSTRMVGGTPVTANLSWEEYGRLLAESRPPPSAGPSAAPAWTGPTSTRMVGGTPVTANLSWEEYGRLLAESQAPPSAGPRTEPLPDTSREDLWLDPVKSWMTVQQANAERLQEQIEQFNQELAPWLRYPVSEWPAGLKEQIGDMGGPGRPVSTVTINITDNTFLDRASIDYMADRMTQELQFAGVRT